MNKDIVIHTQFGAAPYVNLEGYYRHIHIEVVFYDRIKIVKSHQNSISFDDLFPTASNYSEDTVYLDQAIGWQQTPHINLYSGDNHAKDAEDRAVINFYSNKILSGIAQLPKVSYEEELNFGELNKHVCSFKKDSFNHSFVLVDMPVNDSQKMLMITDSNAFTLYVHDKLNSSQNIQQNYTELWRKAAFVSDFGKVHIVRYEESNILDDLYKNYKWSGI